ncbi:MAG TPA: PAS domain S-box protein [Burkholderiales bacterium]|nr:PAS domain S-box protein [Burkholderiales bacterium]
MKNRSGPGRESLHDAQRLHEARMAALHRVAATAYAATLLNATILLIALWGAIGAQLLIAWFGVVLVVTAARLAIHLRFARARADGKLVEWERRFALGVFAAGAVWAAAPAILFPEVDPLRQMAVVFVIGGSIIGAAGVYGASQLAFYSFSALPFLAVVVQFVLQPEGTYRLLGLMVIVFGAAMLRAYRQYHLNIVETLRTRFENEELVARQARSEARLRDAIESFPDAIAVWNERDALVVCNEAYAHLHGRGRKPEELVGIRYVEIAENAFDMEIVPPEQRERRDVWLEHRVRMHREGAGELHQFQTRDGRWHQAKTVRAHLGGYVSVVSDITDLKRAQDAYLTVLAEENLVLETLPAGVAFVENRVIVRCNRRLEQMLGYQPGALRGASTRVLYGSDERWRRAGDDLYRRLASGAIAEDDARLARVDGTSLWCRVLGRALDPAAAEASSIFAFSDASERVAAEQALRASEALYRNLVETSNDLIWSVDSGKRWTYLNPLAARRIYGYGAQELIGRPLGELSAPAVAERDAAVFGRILGGESVFDYETRHERRDGAAVDVSFNAIPLRDASGAIIGATGTARDVSEQKRAAAALHENVEKLRLAVDTANLYYWEWDVASDSLRWGRDPEGLVGRRDERAPVKPDFRDLVHPDDRERFLAAGRQALASCGPYAVEFRTVTRDGEVRWISARGSVITGADGTAAKMIGVSQDVTERKRQEEEVRFLAYHDTLTGLPNRRLLDDRLRQAIYLAQRRDTKVAAMLVDLDDFKRVNDELGHRAGDAVLREVAQRLAGCVRKADTLARHGGDEFVAVLPDLQRESDCEVVAGKILAALEPEFRVEGRGFRIGASIGISIYPTDAGDGETLLRNADAAMYRGKERGRNQFRFFGR